MYMIVRYYYSQVLAVQLRWRPEGPSEVGWASERARALEALRRLALCYSMVEYTII